MQTKKWGKADKAALSRLIEDRDLDIYDTSTANIDGVGAAHFPHRKKNFRRNFHDFAASFSVEKEYSGARRKEEGESSRLIVAYELLTFFQPCQPPLPINDR